MTEVTILTFTNTAIAYLTDKVAREQASVGVRISLKKAGCSGLQYVLDYVHDVNPKDEKLLAGSDLIVYVDKAAVPYILGSTVDYVKEGLGGKIKFINPNESSSCGCGESFHV